MSQSIGKGKEAPSVIPKYSTYCTIHAHKIVAHRIANDRLTLIQSITKLKGLSYLMHRKSHK